MIVQAGSHESGLSLVAGVWMLVYFAAFVLVVWGLVAFLADRRNR